jgi:hypothetical protein
METSALHALKHDQVATGISHRDRDRSTRLLRRRDRGRHHRLGACMGQALAIGDVHGAPRAPLPRFSNHCR